VRVCVCVTLKTLKDTATNWNASAHRCSNETAATRAATHCITLQHTATHCNTLRHTATHSNTMQRNCSDAGCNTLHRTPTHCNRIKYTATHYNTFSHRCDNETTATRLTTHHNTLQHTPTHWNTPWKTAIHAHIGAATQPQRCRLQDGAHSGHEVHAQRSSTAGAFTYLACIYMTFVHIGRIFSMHPRHYLQYCRCIYIYGMYTHGNCMCGAHSWRAFSPLPAVLQVHLRIWYLNTWYLPAWHLVAWHLYIWGIFSQCILAIT